MSNVDPLKGTEGGMTPVEAMSDDQLLESLHEAFRFLEEVPAIGVEVLDRVVETLSEFAPDVTEAVSGLVGSADVDDDSDVDEPSEA
jgi:hypothetical protein